MGEILNNRDNYWDKRISFYVIYYFIASSLNATIKHLFVLGPSLYKAVSVIVGISIVLFMLIPIKEVFRRSSKLLIGSIVLFFIIYLISVILAVSRGEPSSYVIKGTAFLTFAWWIPVGVYSCSVKDKEILYQICLKGSWVISALMILLWLNNRQLGDTQGYSMFLGFAIIIPLLFHINEFVKNHNIFYFILILLEVFIVVVFANRGVVLSLLVFVLFKLIFESKGLLGKGVSFLIVIIASAFLLAYQDKIVIWAIGMLGSMGYNSRTLNMILADAISDSSGREGIWNICFGMISERPFFGWGLGGEYYTIANRMGATSEDIITAFSAHNGLIQNYVNFGLLFGTVASLVVIVPLFAVKKLKDSCTRSLFEIFACSSIVPCLVSADGFFTRPAVAIALYLFYFNNKKFRNEINKSNPVVPENDWNG